MNKKVLLVYSGGLETSVAIHWLRYKKDFKVFSFSANLGRETSLESIGELALTVGAETAHIADLRERFVEEYVKYAIKANVQYDLGCYLSTALAIPIIASRLVKIADEYDYEYVAHGIASDENDKTRFKACINSLNPQLKIIEPLNIWPFKTRDQVVEYANRYRLPISLIKKSQHNIDQNLWGNCVYSTHFSDHRNTPPSDVFTWTSDLADALPEPQIIEIEFHRGVPVGLESEKLSLIEIIDRLNKIGGRHGIGLSDLLDNKIGIKSRGYYEAPAATILITAHKALEDITLSKDLLRYKNMITTWYSELVYNGNWFSDLKKSLDSFFEKSQENVTGYVRMKLFKGNCVYIGRRSTKSLFMPSHSLGNMPMCRQP